MPPSTPTSPPPHILAMLQSLAAGYRRLLARPLGSGKRISREAGVLTRKYPRHEVLWSLCFVVFFFAFFPPWFHLAPPPLLLAPALWTTRAPAFFLNSCRLLAPPESLFC